jgi:hypothetical protein
MDTTASRRPLPSRTPRSVKAIINAILSLPDQSPQSISASMADRVSPRTIYRWAKGEHAPQRPGDYTALLRLAEQHGVAVEDGSSVEA